MQLMQPIFGKAKHSREYREYLSMTIWQKILNAVYFDWVQLVLSILILLAPFPFMYDWSYSNRSEQPAEAVLTSRATLYSAAEQPVVKSSNDKLPDGVEVVQNLPKGAKVKLLGYTGKAGRYGDQRRCFQVESAEGNVGFIHYSAVCPLEELPTVGKDVPEIYLTRERYGIKATSRWIDRHVVPGETTVEEIDGEWWGVPLAVKKTGKTVKKYYPIDVTYEEMNCEGLCITFEDGKVRSVSHASEEKATKTWLNKAVVAFRSGDASARLHADKLSGSPSSYRKQGWFMGWVAIPLLTILTWLGWFLYFFTLTNFAGMLVHWWGYIPFVGWLLPLVLTIASTLAALAAVVFWEASTVLWVCAGIMLLANGIWFGWCKWNYCYRCRRFFTKEKYGESHTHHDEYEDWDEHEITTRTTTYADGRKEKEVVSDVVKNRWRDRIRHNHDAYYVVCCNCGKRTVIREHSEHTKRSRRDK